MFYQPKEGHGLPHDPFKSCIVPRPIGWISTISSDGVVNLAPYSYFNGVCGEPPMVMFASNGWDGAKDTIRNCEATGEFVINMATWDTRLAVSASAASVPPEVDEMQAVGLTAAPSRLVKAPRVAETPIHMECRYYQTMELPSTREGRRNAMVVGEVIGIHISDEVLVEGMIDLSLVRPLARLGYLDYAVIDGGFPIVRPK